VSTDKMVPVSLLGLCPLSCHVLPTPFIIGSIDTNMAMEVDNDTKIRVHYTHAVKCALQETVSVALRTLKPRHDCFSG